MTDIWRTRRRSPRPGLGRAPLVAGAAVLLARDSVESPSYDNNFGIDVDVYDLVIEASTGILPIVATSEKDGIRRAVLALAADVE